jgi:hypothetical protein
LSETPPFEIGSQGKEPVAKIKREYEGIAQFKIPQVKKREPTDYFQ